MDRDRGGNAMDPKTNPPKDQGSTWAKMVGRKEKKGAAPPPPKSAKPTVAGEQGSGNKPGKTGKRREPRTSVVTITCAADNYGEIIREAKSKIVLANLKIDDGMRCKWVITGACLFEIPGPDGEEKAKNLE